MSIRVMAHVWQHSKHKGSDLLLLLAIADFADDHGIAYPNVGTLAKKTRLQERNVQYRLKALSVSNELTILPGKGPNGTHLYHIHMPQGHSGDTPAWGTPDPTPGVQSLRVQSLHPEEPEISKDTPGGGAIFAPGVQSLQGAFQCTQTVIRSLREENPKEKECTLYTLPGEAAVALPQEAAAQPLTAMPETKHPKLPAPLAADDWLKQLLDTYHEDFDVSALNDDKWWADVANSFPVFNREWVARAFSDLAEWLERNKPRRPRNARGWKTRMKFSLNYFYDKDQRRQAYGHKTAPYR